MCNFCYTTANLSNITAIAVFPNIHSKIFLPKHTCVNIRRLEQKQQRNRPITGTAEY